MKVRKVVRPGPDDNVAAAVNAVVASSSGEQGTVGATSTQHVEIIQRHGHTEVHEHHSNEKES